MLGVGFDALNQRDLKRRYRRLVAVTAGSLGIAVVTVALAIVATAARQDAELRRTQAEDLVDFMLGDLYESLYELDRLDLYDRIGDKALEYFASQRDDDATGRTLAQRARNLRQIGEVRMDRGDLAAALDAFSESLLITTRVAASNNAPDAIIDVANSRFFVGQVHYLRGDLPKARAEFEQVLPLVTGLLEADPRNPRWLVETGFAYTNLGRVLELEGALEEALAAYEAVMSANLTLRELEPDNPEWDLEVGFAHNNIGKVVIGLGRLDTAESHYRSDLEAKARVLALTPSHSMRRENLAVSQLFLGELLLDRGKLEESSGYLQDALSTFDVLLKTDPERTNWRTRRANVARALGRLYWAEGRSEAGRDSLRDSIEALSLLVESDEANVAWRRDLVQSLLASADLEGRAGNVAVARAALNSSQQHQVALEARELRNRDTALLAIHVEVCAGELAARDDPDAARSTLASALESIRKSFPGSADPHLLELRARALGGLGRADEAAAIRSALQAIGFHTVMI
jgi:tetratricopeptide (TPR) repeat protein